MEHDCFLKIQKPSAVLQEMKALLKALFPLPRTLISDGFDQSLGILQKILPLQVFEHRTGERVWDWVIPEAWNVREATIEDSRGKRLVDYRTSNLHLSAYSVPFHGIVTKEELFKHLKSLPDFPEAIPYNNLYYRKDWQFNIAHNQLPLFQDKTYRVHIDADLRPGRLKIAECYLPGRTQEEIFFSTYMCHPSMANDNLSGVIVCTELFRHLLRLKDRKYSYRLIIIPETIGAITYLAKHGNRLKNLVGGINLYICGDPGPVTYKRSYHHNNLIDRAAALALAQRGKPYSIRPFAPLGSDERQYNAPGVRLPVGTLTRTPPTEFREYHTSKDDLSFVKPEALYDSLDALLHILQTLECNETYMNLYKGEPCFSKYKMVFESYHDIKNDASKNYFRFLTNEINGRNSLLDIAEKWGVPMEDLSRLAAQFVKYGLIRKTRPTRAGKKNP
jgi:aminopeptidase-like protein